MKHLIEEIVDIKGRIEDLKEEVNNLAEYCIGKELVYNGNHGSVLYISDNLEYACIYLEDADGVSWDEYLYLDELLEIL